MIKKITHTMMTLVGTYLTAKAAYAQMPEIKPDELAWNKRAEIAENYTCNNQIQATMTLVQKNGHLKVYSNGQEIDHVTPVSGEDSVMRLYLVGDSEGIEHILGVDEGAGFMLYGTTRCRGDGKIAIIPLKGREEDKAELESMLDQYNMIRSNYLPHQNGPQPPQAETRFVSPLEMN